MQETVLPLEKINYIAKQLPKYTSPEHLQRALQLYMMGAVEELEMIKHSSIDAEVGKRQVKINLDFLLFSSCTCGYKGICQHMAAAFMSVYAMIESPEKLFVTEAQEPRSNKVSAKPAAKPSNVTQPPLSSETPEQWLRYFEQIFNTYHQVRAYTIPGLFEKIIGELTAPAYTWATEKGKLYAIHAVLFALQRLEGKFRNDPGKDYYQADYERAFGILYSTLFSASDTVTFEKSIQSYLEPIHALLTGNVLVRRNTPVDWVIVYSRLWWTVLKEPALLNKEKRRIQAVIHQSALPSEEKNLYVPVLAHLEVIVGDDKRARERLAPFIWEHADDVQFILHHLAQAKQWDRMMEWLKWYLIGHCQDNEHEQEMIFQYCALLARQEGPIADQAGALLKGNLPFSFEFYASYLLHANQPKAWVDLHMWAGLDPSLITKEDLMKIELLDPRMLLPMYHQSIEQYISLKNRSGYKEAVKLLRKLHSYYKKLNEPARWVKYMQRLLVQHRRLRAFCEELEKGNLMP